VKVSVSQLHWAIKTDQEYFGFSISVITYRAAPKPPKRGKCFSPFGFPLAVSTRASLAGYVSATIATGWKSCRFAVPSLGPEASGLQAAPFSKISESPARS
jgi:hypothetical protein